MSDLEVRSEPDQTEIDELRARLVDYNISKHGYRDVFKRAVFVRNEDGSLAAGVYAYGWGGCFEVELLWVAEERRGEGLGTRLMTAIENEASQLGFSKIVLDTFSFQAPEFYERLGFERVGTIADFPEGHEHFMFVKRL